MKQVTYSDLLTLLPSLPNLNSILTNQARTEYVLHFSNGSRFSVSSDNAQSALNALFLLLAPSSVLTHQIILIHANLATTRRLRGLKAIDALINSEEVTKVGA